MPGVTDAEQYAALNGMSHELWSFCAQFGLRVADLEVIQTVLDRGLEQYGVSGARIIATSDETADHVRANTVEYTTADGPIRARPRTSRESESTSSNGAESREARRCDQCTQTSDYATGTEIHAMPDSRDNREK